MSMKFSGCKNSGSASPQLLLLFSSRSAVRATVTCERRNPHKQQLILSFFFLCRSVLGSVVLFLLFFPSSSKWQLWRLRKECWRPALPRGSFGVEGDEEIEEDGEAADERGEQRGTTLPSFWSWRIGGWRREQLRGKDDRNRGAAGPSARTAGSGGRWWRHLCCRLRGEREK
jgi:hypothetical protein